VPQREDRDCTIAVLSMISGCTYEDALRTACDVDDEGASDGLWVTQLIDAANVLGVPLKRRRRFDIGADAGILYLVDRKDDCERHVVLLKKGIVIDTDGYVWFSPEKYLRHYNYEPRLLLVEAA
jgi:hypothetical protein